MDAHRTDNTTERGPSQAFFALILVGFLALATFSTWAAAGTEPPPFRILSSGKVTDSPSSWVENAAAFLAYGQGSEVTLVDPLDYGRTLSRFETRTEISGAAILGNFLILGERDYGLEIFDVGDPYHPVAVDRIPMPGSRFFVGAEGDSLVVLAEEIGLTHFHSLHDSASEPLDLATSEFMPLPDGASSVALLDGKAFVALRSGELGVVDLSGLSRPNLLRIIPLLEPVRALAAAGGSLLAQGTSGAIWAIDPAMGTPDLLARDGLPPAAGLCAAGRRIYTAGAGGVESFTGGRDEATTVTVKVGSNFFNPSAITVAPGDTVRWSWVGGTHSSTSGGCPTGNCAPDGLWDSGNKSSGNFDRVFNDAPGIYPYFCKIHASAQTGTVTVQASQCNLSCTATATPSTGQAPLTVAFNATGDAQHCDGVIAYGWDFGDGGTATTQTANHTYATAGTFSWTLTATIQDQTCTKGGTVTITAPCSLTCAASASPTTGTSPLAVAFTGSATATNCTGAPAYAWDFGDGITSALQNPGHTYAAAGTYTWTLTVSVDGQVCTQTGSITVTQPPVCTLTCAASAAPATGTAPLAVAFTASATATDCAQVPSYSWSFGDGGSSTQQNPSHTYTSAGAYGWTLTVSSDGQTCTQAGTVDAFGSGGLPGDANGDGVVSIGEVQQSINMFLGTQPPGNGVDCSGDATVSIGEVQKVINAFLGLPSSC